MNTQPTPQDRARWMSLLATAPASLLSQAVSDFGPLPVFQWLRQPETGLTMVRARIGGTGAQFNLGEMSMTRCALRLHSGEMGLAYVAGRDKRHAEWAAIFDALMQSPRAEKVREVVLSSIEQALMAKREHAAAQAQATRVEFLTMVRGEDA